MTWPSHWWENLREKEGQTTTTKNIRKAHWNIIAVVVEEEKKHVDGSDGSAHDGVRHKLEHAHAHTHTQLMLETPKKCDRERQRPLV